MRKIERFNTSLSTININNIRFLIFFLLSSSLIFFLIKTFLANNLNLLRILEENFLLLNSFLLDFFFFLIEGLDTLRLDLIRVLRVLIGDSSLLDSISLDSLSLESLFLLIKDLDGVFLINDFNDLSLRVERVLIVNFLSDSNSFLFFLTKNLNILILDLLIILIRDSLSLDSILLLDSI